MKPKYGLALLAVLITTGFMVPKSVSADKLASNDRDIAAEVEQDPAFSSEVNESWLEWLAQEQQKSLGWLEYRKKNSDASANMERVASIADELFDGLDPEKPILVEFRDHNCANCSDVLTSVTELHRRHPDLQRVILQYPIIGMVPSHIVSHYALTLKATEGQEAYERFSDAMMNLNRPASLTSADNTLAALGFDVAAVNRAATEFKWAEAQGPHAGDTASALGGIFGTPVFVGPGGIHYGPGTPEELEVIAMPQNK